MLLIPLKNGEEQKMKKNKSSNQGRLMRNKTSMMSILVTALLIFSSVVSAIATIENSEQEEMNINVIETEPPVNIYWQSSKKPKRDIC